MEQQQEDGGLGVEVGDTSSPPSSSHLRTESEPKRSRTCQVCRGPTETYHLNYGASACFSCRAFFRRVIQQDKRHRFVCKGGGDCQVTPKTRRRCQRCRFDQCLRAGMKAECVLNEDGKKERFKKMFQKHEQQLQKLQSTSSSSSSAAAAAVASSSSAKRSSDLAPPPPSPWPAKRPRKKVAARQQQPEQLSLSSTTPSPSSSLSPSSPRTKRTSESSPPPPRAPPPPSAKAKAEGPFLKPPSVQSPGMEEVAKRHRRKDFPSRSENGFFFYGESQEATGRRASVQEAGPLGPQEWSESGHQHHLQRGSWNSPPGGGGGGSIPWISSGSDLFNRPAWSRGGGGSGFGKGQHQLQHHHQDQCSSPASVAESYQQHLQQRQEWLRLKQQHQRQEQELRMLKQQQVEQQQELFLLRQQSRHPPQQPEQQPEQDQQQWKQQLALEHYRPPTEQQQQQMLQPHQQEQQSQQQHDNEPGNVDDFGDPTPEEVLEVVQEVIKKEEEEEEEGPRDPLFKFPSVALDSDAMYGKLKVRDFANPSYAVDRSVTPPLLLLNPLTVLPEVLEQEASSAAEGPTAAATGVEGGRGPGGGDGGRHLRRRRRRRWRRRLRPPGAAGQESVRLLRDGDACVLVRNQRHATYCTVFYLF